MPFWFLSARREVGDRGACNPEQQGHELRDIVLIWNATGARIFMKLVVATLLSGLMTCHALVFAAEPEAAPRGPSEQRTLLGPGVLQRAVAREIAGLPTGAPRAHSKILLLQTHDGQSRGWAKRHPVLLGTLVGFGAGFGLGSALGRNGGIADWSAGFSAWVFGGIGAGAGATIGRFVE